MQQQDISAERLFKRADRNCNNTLTIEELEQEVKSVMPEHFSGLNFIKLMNAMDLNGNGVIEMEEFVNLMDNVSQQDLDTSQYSKVKGILKGAISEGVTHLGDGAMNRAKLGAQIHLQSKNTSIQTKHSKGILSMIRPEDTLSAD